MNLTMSKQKKIEQRVAIVDYWPNINNAETECIIRIVSAFKSLNYECILINRLGFLITDSSTHVDEVSVDFVLALHFDSAKCWDAFTYFALWNPIEFYFQWNYIEKTNNVLSGDGFLSCGSLVADDHIARNLIGIGRSCDNVFLNLYHSTSENLLNFSTVSRKLFYCGINWEKLSKKSGRHHELLKILDDKKIINIYGPELFEGVRVWDGYNSYQGSIAFDGKSLIKKIAQSGIGLVLSSEAHIKSGLMSSRLFESLAAGVPIICDQNPFAIKYFGDLLLYIDTNKPPYDVANQILNHIDWIKDNADAALEMARKAQLLYIDKFSLNVNLKHLLIHGDHLSEVNSVKVNHSLVMYLITSECDYLFINKVKRLVEFANGKEFVQPVLVLPSGISSVRLDELKEISNLLLFIFYSVKPSMGNIHLGLIDTILDHSSKLSEDSLIQVIHEFESTSFNMSLASYDSLNSNCDIDLCSGGFSVKSNTANPDSGVVKFIPKIELDNIFDANAPFCVSSMMFRNGFFLSISSAIRHMPNFCFRLLYLYAVKHDRIKFNSKFHSVFDFDIYSNKFRSNSIDDISIEARYANDLLGQNFVNKILSSSIALPNFSQVNGVQLVDSLDNSAIKRIIEKIFIQLPIPRVIRFFIKFFWIKLSK